MRFLFKIKWPVDTLSTEEVRTALVELTDKLFMQQAEATASDGLVGLMFRTETLSVGSKVCIQARRWFEDKKVPIILRVHEMGWHVDFDFLDFLVHNLGWTAVTMESVIRGLKGNRGKRPNKAARDARLVLEHFMERNGRS